MSRDQTQLNPLVQILAKKLVEKCAEQGLKVKITDCCRSKEEQNSLPSTVTQVKYPYSFHNWGLAFDICQNVTGYAYPSDVTWWKKVGDIGESLGLTWGGNWESFKDRPHFQLDAYGTVDEMIKKYGSPDKFRATTDWNVVTPKLAINPKSQFRKIIWMQAMICVSGIPITVDGVWGKKTTYAIQKFWGTRGTVAKGNLCSKKMITLLASML